MLPRSDLYVTMFLVEPEPAIEAVPKANFDYALFSPVVCHYLLLSHITSTQNYSYIYSEIFLFVNSSQLRADFDPDRLLHIEI